MTRYVSNGLHSRPLMSTNDDVSESNMSRDEDSQPASVENLVRKCAECFDNDENCSNEEFLRTLFLTHLWFMTSEQLMVLFSHLYEQEKMTEGFGKKIFCAIRYWMKACPHMFDLDLKLVNALQELQESSLNDPDVDSSIIDLSNKDSYKWMSEANMSIRPNQVNRKRRKVSLVFNHLEPEEIAIHMSYLEYKSFRRLTLTDFHKYAVHGAIKDNLKLERAVFLFNNITHWVQCMILDHHKPQERAHAIVKFIEVAKKLHAMHNFNTLMAIVGALTHTTISRLKKTMAVVPKDSLKTLEGFVDLLDSKSNYCGYRRAYNQVMNKFKIPVIGILMKDLIAVQAALPDRLGDGLINVRKMTMIGGKFQELVWLQKFGFPYEVNRDLVNTLRVSLYLYYNEEEIYQLSLAREPRDVKYSTSGMGTSPAKMFNMGFAEFASFTCQLDDETNKQHVTAMVQSVFKTYDEDADGFISETEFGNFIQNFPGLDSFSTVDKDRDGQISMKEMVDYFLKISSSRRNQVCQSFKHDFTETTYFHPTFCEECEKLLWGLVKQGWKCKECGINCHKHCKDRIVLECRPKSVRTPSNTSQTSKKRNKRREKASISSESDYSLNGDPFRASANEDEAFEGNETRVPSATVQRSVSLMSADLTSGKYSLQPGRDPRKMKSKTPPPIRKHSSPVLNHEVGRKSFQRKMQSILKKKSTKHTVQEETVAVSSIRNGKSSRAIQSRQDSSGEEPDIITHLPRVTEQETVADEEEESLSFPSSSEQLSENPSINDKVQTLVDRRDSGLSSCSCLTQQSASVSAPVTPLCCDHSTSELRFQYPTTENPTAKNLSLSQRKSTGPSEVGNFRRCLFEENERLRQENHQLQKQLLTANDVIQQLQIQLSAYTSTT